MFLLLLLMLLLLLLFCRSVFCFFFSFLCFGLCFVLFCFGFCRFACQTEKIDRFADVDGRSHLETTCSFRQFMRDAWVVMGGDGGASTPVVWTRVCRGTDGEREREREREIF